MFLSEATYQNFTESASTRLQTHHESLSSCACLHMFLNSFWLYLFKFLKRAFHINWQLGEYTVKIYCCNYIEYLFLMLNSFIKIF